MSSIIPVIIVFLAMLIQATLQLVPGGFAIFYHSALGKLSAKRADDISLYYILGVEFAVSLIWLLVYAVMYAIFCTVPDFNNTVLTWIMAGIFGAEAVAVFFCYFRKGRSTALFIPRSLAQNIRTHARRAKSRKDAILLGMFVGLPELVFTLPLYVISAMQALQFVTVPPYLVIILYILASMVPCFVVRAYFRAGLNLAEIERRRLRMKQAVRLALVLLYALVAICVINLGVMQNG